MQGTGVPLPQKKQKKVSLHSSDEAPHGLPVTLHLLPEEETPEEEKPEEETPEEEEEEEEEGALGTFAGVVGLGVQPSNRCLFPIAHTHTHTHTPLHVRLV